MTLPGAEASGPSKLRFFQLDHCIRKLWAYIAEGGFLCIFLRKYVPCVLAICGGRRYSAVGLSMCPT